MSEHDKLLAALGPGEMCGLPEDMTVAFLERTWHIKSALLDGDGGALLISPDPVERVNAAEIAAELMKLAANVLIIGCDWNKSQPGEIANIGVQMFLGHYNVVYQQHMALLAERGKPS